MKLKSNLIWSQNLYFLHIRTFLIAASTTGKVGLLGWNQTLLKLLLAVKFITWIAEPLGRYEAKEALNIL